MTPEERFQRLESSIKEISDKLPKAPKELAIAYCVDVEAATVPAASKSDVEYLESRLRWMQEDLNYVREMYYKHMEGHLPKIVGATAMQKALKAIGLDGDYEVEKKTIYANDGTVSSEQFLISRPPTKA